MQLLNKGAYGEIQFVLDPKTNKTIAVKKNYRDDYYNNTLTSVREYDNLCKLKNCPYIIKVLDIIPKLNGIYDNIEFHFEKADMNLDEYLTRVAAGVYKCTLKERKSLIYDIFLGIKYLHDKKLIHADLKPQNILIFLQNNKYECAKIADFGLTHIKNRLFNQESITTIFWRAPEIYLNYFYDQRIDIWAFGLIIMQILSPYNHMPLFNKQCKDIVATQADIVDKINRIKIIIKEFELIDRDPDLRDLLKYMLQINNRRRFKIDMILYHRYFFCSENRSYLVFDSLPDSKEIILDIKDSLIRQKLLHKLKRYSHFAPYLTLHALDLIDRYLYIDNITKLTDLEIEIVFQTLFLLVLKYFNTEFKDLRFNYKLIADFEIYVLKLFKNHNGIIRYSYVEIGGYSRFLKKETVYDTINYVSKLKTGSYKFFYN